MPIDYTAPFNNALRNWVDSARTGYLVRQDQADRQNAMARQQQADAMRQQEFDMRRQEYESRIAEQQRQQQQQANLQNAMSLAAQGRQVSMPWDEVMAGPSFGEQDITAQVPYSYEEQVGMLAPYLGPEKFLEMRKPQDPYEKLPADIRARMLADQDPRIASVLQAEDDRKMRQAQAGKPVAEKIDLGDRVRVWNQDGTYQDIRKGAAPSVGGVAKPKPVTKGQEAADRAFAKEYVDFSATGGYADVEKNLTQLREALDELKAGGNLTGPITGAVPDFIRNAANPRSVAVRDTVEEVVQRNLRLILGAQFTQREGERLIARSYNERLPEAENVKRVSRLIEQIETAARTKQDAADYWEEHGTLTGWKGKMPSASDFNPEKPSVAELSDDDILKALKGQ